MGSNQTSCSTSASGTQSKFQQAGLATDVNFTPVLLSNAPASSHSQTKSSASTCSGRIVFSEQDKSRRKTQAMRDATITIPQGHQSIIKSRIQSRPFINHTNLPQESDSIIAS